MDAMLKKSWVEALRSGQYRQARDELRTAADKFCCLGVLCQLTAPELWSNVGTELSVRHDGMNSFPSGMMLDKWQLRSATAQTLAKMNDDGKTFAEIADWIEQNIR